MGSQCLYCFPIHLVLRVIATFGLHELGIVRAFIRVVRGLNEALKFVDCEDAITSTRDARATPKLEMVARL